jgi:hypothetical protein
MKTGFLLTGLFKNLRGDLKQSKKSKLSLNTKGFSFQNVKVLCEMQKSLPSKFYLLVFLFNSPKGKIWPWFMMKKDQECSH